MAKIRNQNIDLIKIIAMAFVIGMHTGTTFYVGNIDINRFYKLTIFGTAIPLFFTVSGYLLLGRNKINWQYSAKKIWGIVRFVFVVCWIYWIGRFLITGEPLWDKLYKDPLGAFLMGGTFWQFWYFGAMNIIYFAYPFLNKVYNDKYNVFKCVFVTFICISTIIYLVNIITPGTLESKFPQSLRVWNWFMYFCLGGFIKKNEINIQWKWILLLAVAYCALLVVVIRFNGSMFAADYNYASPLTLCYICCIFQFLNRINISKVSKPIEILSPLFLPVYTLHPFFIYNTQEFRHTFHAGYPIYWMIITVASIAVSWLIMRTKVGKWVFRI